MIVGVFGDSVFMFVCEELKMQHAHCLGMFKKIS